jgi:hypothetical protein
MVDYGIRNNAYAHGVAAPDHVHKFSPAAAPAFESITDWLITLKPRTSRHQTMLLGRRNLNSVNSCWAQDVFTFLGHVIPSPLEQVNKGSNFWKGTNAGEVGAFGRKASFGELGMQRWNWTTADDQPTT